MTLEDRMSFMEGKKAELSSIFENGVWEVETQPERVDHDRVMKARFVLKWTHDAKGNARAKARLVLQGFSDPDLLRGELDTSPTLNRTSRQVVLAVSECLSWARWVTDVATAFLQGDPQTRVLWAKIPKDARAIIGVPAGTFMRLIKPIKQMHPDNGSSWPSDDWKKLATKHILSMHASTASLTKMEPL